jgi:hypothetical protein
MGLPGEADATTLAGELTVLPLLGLEMSSGKSAPGGGGGSWAVGAGRELVVGDQMGEGSGVGDGPAPGVGEGVGVGDGAGVGVAVGPGFGVGVGVGDEPGVGVGVGAPASVVLELPPAHPATSRAAARRQIEVSEKRIEKCEDDKFTTPNKRKGLD